MAESPSRSDDKLPHSVPLGQLERDQFEQAYAEYAPGLRAALRARLRNELDVEECLSRVFEKLWSQGGAIPPAAWRAWLFVVARNEAILLCRKAARRPENQRPAQPHEWAGNQDLNDAWVRKRSSAYDTAECRSREQAPLEQLLEQEEIQRLWQAGERLSSEQLAVLRCRFLEDLPFREIAERLGIPLGTALTRARSAIKRLRDELG